MVKQTSTAAASGLPRIGAPATRALNGIGITQLSQLRKYTESEILRLHGVGPKAIRILREAGAVFASNVSNQS
jgi:predicted flap endonuclease-1-like 5' DNA nuclease